MSKQPPVHELVFLKISQNHGQMSSNLKKLGVTAPEVPEYANHVCECWFRLAVEHLEDAKKCLKVKLERATYSRSYYAAYNASKATRYIVKGWVSTKGDDHQAASDLPDDFPDAADWSVAIVKLREHRERADYDNWADTNSNNTLTASEALLCAEEFTALSRTYIVEKFGVVL